MKMICVKNIIFTMDLRVRRRISRFRRFVWRTYIVSSINIQRKFSIIKLKMIVLETKLSVTLNFWWKIKLRWGFFGQYQTNCAQSCFLNAIIYRRFQILNIDIILFQTLKRVENVLYIRNAHLSISENNTDPTSSTIRKFL